MMAAVLAAAIVFGATPPDAPAPAGAAPAPAPAATAQASTTVANAPAEGPDLELHVPHAEIAKLGLDVENLQARLDIDTSVAGLVAIHAGVVATVQKLKLQLEGVQAETHLVVRLNRVAEIMEHALGTIDQHPDAAGAPSPPTTPPAAPDAAVAPVQPVPAVSVDAAVAPRDAPPPAAQE